MAKAKPIKLKPAHDWYLVEWMKLYGKIQADLERDLEWNKSKASLMWNHNQRYHRDDVNQVADWLNLKPHDLLIHPDDAMALRRMRESALRIAADNPPTPPPATEAKPPLKQVING